MTISRTNTHQMTRIICKSNNHQNIRIKVVYHKDFDHIKYYNVEEYGIKSAVQFLERTLKVKDPFQKPLLLDRPCHGFRKPVKLKGENFNACYMGCLTRISGMEIPAQFFAKCIYFGKDGKVEIVGGNGEGAKNTDIIIFIKLVNCPPNRLAQSKYIALDQETDRPVVGVIEVCRHEEYTKKSVSSKNKDKIKKIILHEFMHILGFSSNLYAYFRDENGHPRTERDNEGNPNNGFISNTKIYKPDENTFIETQQKVYSSNNFYMKDVAMLTTPRLVKEARRHFNCKSLIGVYLEDFGSKENAYSHFEANYFQEELMLASVSFETFVSRLSLALLADSGWYIVDFNQAESYSFGKNLGCDFLNKSCYKYMNDRRKEGKDIYPYCNKPSEKKCSADHLRVEKCSLESTEHNEVPRRNKYFPNKSLVSLDETVDYCPLLKGFQYRFRNTECQGSPFNNTNNLLFNKLWKNSKTSKCFNAPYEFPMSVISEEEKWIFEGTGCYEFKCSKGDRLMVKILNKNYQCKYDGEVIIINSHIKGESKVTGRIICPQCAKFCDPHYCDLRRSKFNQICNTRDGENCDLNGHLIFPNVGIIVRNYKIINFFELLILFLVTFVNL